VLPPAIALQRLKPVAVRNAQIVQGDHGVEQIELPQRKAFDRVELPDRFAEPEAFSRPILEPPYHAGYKILRYA
jgi:hypothetical protein